MKNKFTRTGFCLISLLIFTAHLYFIGHPGECQAFDASKLFSRDIFKNVKDLAVEDKKDDAAPPAAKDKNTVRILTYNIQGVSSFFKISALSKVVKNIDADFVFLTEAVAGNLIYANQPKVIAAAGKYEHILFKGNIRIWTYIEKMGNAILSRTPIYSGAPKDLPKILKDSEQRSILITKTKVNGREIVLICAHLSRIIHKDERIKQIEFIAGLLKSDYAKIPVILAGDFNTSPAEKDVLKPITDIMDEGFLYLCGGESAKMLEGATIPSDKPEVKFDYIFFSRDKFKIKSYQVNAAAVSDHRPFAVDAELK
jgi:endonuclease/exonuclease/phosphatase family metal-dependent hydrolase